MSSRWSDPLASRLPPILRNPLHHRSALIIIKALDVVFHLLGRFWKWIWGTVFVGVFFLTLLLNFAQYGDAHLDHPEHWAIWLFVQSHVAITVIIAAILLVLILLGWISHFIRHTLSLPDNALPFTLVRNLDRASFKMGDRQAETYPYVREPVQATFDRASVTLSAAAKGTGTKQGILVVGEANAGKSRLAYETLQEALPDCDALIWHVADTELAIPSAARLEGRILVVVLDDVQHYATGEAFTAWRVDGQLVQGSVTGPAAVLRKLFDHVCQEAARAVFVATIRREEQKAAEASLGWLFQKLETLEVPTFEKDEHSQEAQKIIAEFAAHGKIRDEWDGTLGSLVLGLATKREEYLALVNVHSLAVPVLHAMKLLTLVGIGELTGRRVRAVCDQILHEPALANAGKVWDGALATLFRLEFMTIATLGNGDVALDIRKDAYFEKVVTEYPPDYQTEIHRGKLLGVLASLEDAPGLFDLAIAFVKLGRDNEALDAFDQATAFDPTDANYWYNKGTMLSHLERHEEALKALDQAIALNPSIASAWGNKGTALVRLRRFAEANDAYDQVLRLDPTDAKAWHNKGAVLFILGRSEEALEAFDRAHALGGPLPEGTLGKVMILLHLKRVDQALATCEEALNVDPNNVVILQLKATILRGLGRDEEALAVNDRLIELAPLIGDNWIMRGAILRSLGREADALIAEKIVKELES